MVAATQLPVGLALGAKALTKILLLVIAVLGLGLSQAAAASMLGSARVLSTD